MHRLFDLAVEPGNIREDNPVTHYMRPPKPKPPVFGYLYPSELVSLLYCADVPVARRVLSAEMRNRYAPAARTLQDLNYVPFPDISAATPELPEQRDNWANDGLWPSWTPKH
jgi:hypothetical protein